MAYHHDNKDKTLTNIHNTIKYDADGEPVLRVSIENIEANAGNLSISGLELGNVSLTVNNDPITNRLDTQIEALGVNVDGNVVMRVVPYDADYSDITNSIANLQASVLNVSIESAELLEITSRLDSLITGPLQIELDSNAVPLDVTITNDVNIAANTLNEITSRLDGITAGPLQIELADNAAPLDVTITNDVIIEANTLSEITDRLDAIVTGPVPITVDANTVAMPVTIEANNFPLDVTVTNPVTLDANNIPLDVTVVNEVTVEANSFNGITTRLDSLLEPKGNIANVGPVFNVSIQDVNLESNPLFSPIPQNSLKTAWGQPKTAQDFSIFSGIWTYNIPVRKWITYVNGVELEDANLDPARARSEQGGLRVYGGPTIGDRTRVSSRRHARYQPNRGFYYSASIACPNPSAAGRRKWGLFTPVPDDDGMYFKLEDGILYACIARAGVENAEAINVPFPIDYGKGNIYDIQAQWRGVGNVNFFIGNPETGNLEYVHTIKHLNTLDAQVYCRTPALPCAFSSENTAGNDLLLWAGCCDVSAEGGRDVQEQYASYVRTDWYANPGAEISMALRVPSEINGLHNTRDVDLQRVTVASDKRVIVKIWISRDPTSITTLNGDLDWTETGLGSFVQSVDTTQISAYDTTKMKLLATFPVGAGQVYSLQSPNQRLINYFLIHEDYLIIEVLGANPTVDTIVEWGEEI